MGKILIIFASSTGNTELMAEAIADYLHSYHHEVDLKTFDFDVIDMEDIEHYDAILVGTYTWDDGELPYEVEDFYDDLEDANLAGKVFGVFGSADSFYDTYGGAIDLVADRAKKLHATVVPERLKVDLDPNEADIMRCQAFADMVCTLIESKLEEKGA
ncbi:flavodoxin [Virgibacillus sp. W0181]|uniref:flavodoxin n=1 Tax=Virgibacillus sp. W0181 TaxID=3391581 RepID=UPI003F4615F1